MPQIYSPVENLEGISLTGFFQKDPVSVGGELDRLAGLSDQNPDFERMRSARIREVKEEGRKFDFIVKVFRYDPNSQIFIAEGIDDFGNSGLVGTIRGSVINFEKIYAGRVPLRAAGLYRSDKISYEGRIVKPDSTVICEGTYTVPGCNGKYNGIWRLESVPKKD